MCVCHIMIDFLSGMVSTSTVIDWCSATRKKEEKDYYEVWRIATGAGSAGTRVGTEEEGTGPSVGSLRLC